MNGWTGKVLRVDLSRGECEEEELDLDLAEEYIGGRGLATRVFFDEVDPNIDPLSPENKLIFATGLLTGTGAPTGGRYMVVTKSPLTGTIHCSNAGGDFGAELKYAGYDMVIIEGKSSTPVYLSINNDDVQLKPAEHLWGKNTQDTEEAIKAETGDEWIALDTHIACIGPAGERLVKMACIMNDKHHALARSGSGTVMGSKNLKAIAVRGTGGVTVADGAAFKEAMLAVWDKVKAGRNTSEFLPQYGTLNALYPMNQMGNLSVHNFQTGTFEGAKNVSSRVLRANYLIRNGGCFSCPIACIRLTRVTDPEFKGEGGGPEFESAALLGPNCGVDNMAAVVKANYICNELGIDTISVGGTIACAMELYEKGYLTEEEAGCQLNFGNAQALVEMVEKMGLREGFGDTLAEGGYRLAEKYGHPELFMGVKKQETATYHVQGAQGTGLEYATSNTGCSHNRALVYNNEVWGIFEPADPLGTDGKAAMCVNMQHYMTVIDISGLCQFLAQTVITPEDIIPLLNAATGLDYTVESLLQAGERIWNLERLLNLKAGFTAKDDTLPRRILEQPMLKGAAEGQVHHLREMLPEYYRLRGWDENGVPTREKLAELGLS
ncbi:MAG: aldehyde ferredoxin oxidoreductase family protein [Dehalococcoidales bacterium]|nr:aldehyde ferredoxin oxidoreductase family protein [Dehalococcoidales bacterium]